MGTMDETIEKTKAARQRLLDAMATQRKAQEKDDALAARHAEERVVAARELAEANARAKMMGKQYVDLVQKLPQLLAADAHGILGSMLKKVEPAADSPGVVIETVVNDGLVEFDVVTEMVVYGASGSGKTVFASVFAEEVHRAKQRFCAVDIKGDFHGLKSSADGRSPAIPAIVFGGDHADLPLEADAGAFIADIVASIAESVILDLEHLSKGKQLRFLTAFFTRLLGRVLLTQRGSGLNKEVSELCELLVAFRTPGPLDQERVKGWLDANTTKAERETVMAQLSGLPTGTAVFASGHPSLKLFGVHQVRMRETFDSSATPKIGQRRTVPKQLAQADLTDIKQKMADAIERQKADDPKELRKRVAELEAQVKKAASASAPKAEAKRVEVPALSAKDRAAIDRMVDHVGKQVERAAAVVADAREFTTELMALASKLQIALAPVSVPLKDGGGKTIGSVTSVMMGARAPLPRPSSPPAASARVESGSGDASLAKGERVVLTAIAQTHGGVTREQIGVLTGYTKSTRNLYLQKLSAAGLYDKDGDRLIANEASFGALGPGFETLPQGDALREHWMEKLPAGERAVLTAACSELFE